VYTLLKSEVGPSPPPHFPRGIDLKAEDRRSRRRLYPVTVIYAVQFVAIMSLALRSGHIRATLAFFVLAVVSWVPIEYFYHRYVLHGIFPNSGGLFRRALHHLFDASHADHHARPWDGNYINGHLDSLYFAAVALPLAAVAPYYTAPVFVSTLLACYVSEEWVHHATHFWNFRWRYFQYLRRRHLYHHTKMGAGIAFSISNGMWDVVAGTRIPSEARAKLSRRRAPRPEGAPPSASTGGLSAHGA
jgi:Fatty acid hydroxylase